MDKIILVGGFHEIVELCELCGVEIIGIIDSLNSDNFLGYPIIGKDEDAPTLINKYNEIPLIITPDKPKIRNKLADYYKSFGFRFYSLISPKSIISKSAFFGEGIIVQSGVNISSSVNIGNFVKVNSCANIMHDCVIENYSTIAPNAVLLGRVYISSECYIGANSTILPSKKIFKAATIGAGSVVTKDVQADDIVAGIPAISIKNKVIN